jgi:UDP-glucuronate 4-epimerase
LLDFIELIEKKLNKKAIRNYMPMQIGDFPETWSDTSLMSSLINYTPNTKVDEGIGHFINWYQEYYKN